MRLGLGARILIAGGIVVLLLVVEFETGTRGYLITRDRRFLAPSRVARTSLPAETRAFQALAPGPFSDEVAVRARAYIRDWAVPVAAIARVSGDTAVVEAATREGKRRVDELRAVIDQFIRSQNRLATSERERIASVERTGIVYAAAGIVITTLLFMAFVGYFLRAAIAPLRRIADATNRVAAGERQVEVPEQGAGEVGELAVAFNDMSRALTAQTRELADQNVDLERLANVLRAVLDSTVDGILLSDAQGNVQLANRPVVTLTRDLGMSYEGSVVDRLLSVQARMRDPEDYRAAMERLRTNPHDATLDEFEDAVTGRVFQGFTAPVRDDRGGFLGRIWTLREVTQQRELDRLKDDFVATVSHELRTPLTSMMGFLEMIREGEAGDLNDEQRRFLAIVYRSSERLQRLVGDLLFVARLDANGLQLQFADVDVTEVVRDAVESTAALARSRAIDLRSELADVPSIFGDRERLSQLVGNLISNALKFTPEGGIVTARTFVDGDSAVIEVTDTGIGIPEVEQSRLFQRFFRSSTATEQAIPGTGLGLVISRAIAEAHGGTISVRSAPGKGTTFRVEIPLEPEEVAA